MALSHDSTEDVCGHRECEYLWHSKAVLSNRAGISQCSYWVFKIVQIGDILWSVKYTDIKNLKLTKECKASQNVYTEHILE